MAQHPLIAYPQALTFFVESNTSNMVFETKNMACLVPLASFALLFLPPRDCPFPLFLPPSFESVAITAASLQRSMKLALLRFLAEFGSHPTPSLSQFTFSMGGEF